MNVYLVIVQDTIIQSREYAVIAKDEASARDMVAQGKFLTESEATTMDTLKTAVISTEKVGQA